jgi:hypothetical protein
MGTPDRHRLDHELMEMLNELRVALPGMQMLFAFLLTIPFAHRFASVTAGQKWVFMGDLACTTLSSLFLIAPSVYHRLHWRRDVEDKSRMLVVFNRLAIWGGIFLALAIVSSIFLITDFVVGRDAAIGTTVAIGALTVTLWYGLPLVRRQSENKTAHRGESAR